MGNFRKPVNSQTINYQLYNNTLWKTSHLNRIYMLFFLRI